MSLTFALQSLLARHEAYVLEAEDERRKMAASIDRLECDKKELEAANAKTIEENRSLLDQLEELSNVVSTSDSQIMSLNAKLESTHQELNRINALAARAVQLEAQLSLMEMDHKGLNDKLLSSEEDCRSLNDRYKDAERTISTLQEQIDRIEGEAIDERVRHEEVMSRYERRRTVERQLESAAGRLKGAAAATTMGKSSTGKNHVVSHFVKDILANNASLQMGIMELREMLMGSNEEVQNLRQQMLLHQEVPSDQRPDNPLVTMEKDLARSTLAEPDSLPALHVHHHYHEAGNAEPGTRQRSVRSRRPRKRSSRITSGASTPRSGLETPRTPISQHIRTRSPSIATTILSQTAGSIPPPPQYSYPHRLSTHSGGRRPSFAPSSEPSSAHPSMFDFLSESSRPTSPADSNDVFSPSLLPVRGKRAHSTSSHGPCSPRTNKTQPPNTHDGLYILDDYLDKCGSIPHRSRANSTAILEGPESESHQDQPPDSHMRKIGQPAGLRRTASHESIFPISADSSRHTSNALRNKHSLIFRGSSHPSVAAATPTTALISNNSVVSASHVTISPSPALSSSTHEQLPTSNRTASASATLNTLSSSFHQAPASDRSDTLGKRMGGWVWGKWGTAPSPTSTSSPNPTFASSASVKAKGKEERHPGVNQKGSLRALKNAVNTRDDERSGKRLSSHVEAKSVDEVALRESLGEG
ncbi:MAG: hypothetical protein Q9218_007811 [Villophora microphyllina]